MNELTRSVLSLSVSGSVLIALFLAVGPRLNNLVSKTWRYYIWLVVLARLLLPVAVPVNLTAALFHSAGLGAAADPARQGEPVQNTFGAAEGDGGGEMAADVEETGSHGAASSQWANAAALGALVWAGGAALTLLLKFGRHLQFVRAARRGGEPVADEGLLTACEDARIVCGLRKKPPLLYSPAISTPMLAGVFRPCLLLPSRGFDKCDGFYIFLHELTHYRRCDLLYKWLLQLTVCLHWFNPLVYIMQKRVEQCCELSCDEAAARLMNEKERHRYGDVLLRAACPACEAPHGMLSAPLQKNAMLLKERLVSLMKFQKPTASRRLTATLLSLAVAGGAVLCGYAAPAHATEKAGARDTKNSFQLMNGVTYFNRMTFADSYIVGIGWNVTRGSYPVQRQITVDGKALTVRFQDNTAKYADNTAVMKAVQKAVAGFSQKEGKALAVTAPLVTSIAGPYNESADALAERFYEEDSVAYFAAVVEGVSSQTADKLVQRAYDDDETGMLSIVSSKISDSKRRELLDRAYRENEVSAFHVFAADLSEGEARQFAQRAYDDDKPALFSAMAGALSAKEAAGLAERALRENRLSLFSLLVDKVDDNTVNTLAELAYRENDLPCFSILQSKFTDAQRASWVSRVKQDGKSVFLYVMNN